MFCVSSLGVEVRLAKLNQQLVMSIHEVKTKAEDRKQWEVGHRYKVMKRMPTKKGRESYHTAQLKVVNEVFVRDMTHD